MSLSYISGLILGIVCTMAHNFYHKADNFRRYYHDLSSLSSSDSRITHVLSHHVFTNTIYDIEIAVKEPVLPFLPDPRKQYRSKILSCVMLPVMIVFFLPLNWCKQQLQLISRRSAYRWEHLFPHLEIAVMSFIAGDLCLGLK